MVELIEKARKKLMNILCLNGTLLLCLIILHLNIASNTFAENSEYNVQRYNIISYYNSYLSPNNSMLALDLWWKSESGILKKDLGFLDLHSKKLSQHTIGLMMTKYSDIYVEIKGFCWDPSSQYIYFSLIKPEWNKNTTNIKNKIFSYNLVTSSIEIIDIKSIRNQIMYPVVLVDGKSLVFLTYDSKIKRHATCVLYYYGISSRELRVLSEDCFILRPALSPDGNSILYRKDQGIFLKKIDTGKCTMVKKLRKEQQIGSIHFCEDRIFFVLIEPPFSEFEKEMKKYLKGKIDKEPSYIREVWEFTLRGKIPAKKIVTFSTMKSNICFQGNSLFVSLPNEMGGSNIWNYNISGKTLRQLTFGANIDDLPIYLAREQKIIFRRNLKELYSVDADGKEKPIRLYGVVFKNSSTGK